MECHALDAQDADQLSGVRYAPYVVSRCRLLDLLRIAPHESMERVHVIEGHLHDPLLLNPAWGCKASEKLNVLVAFLHAGKVHVRFVLRLPDIDSVSRRPREAVRVGIHHKRRVVDVMGPFTYVHDVSLREFEWSLAANAFEEYLPAHYEQKHDEQPYEPSALDSHCKSRAYLSANEYADTGEQYRREPLDVK